MLTCQMIEKLFFDYTEISSIVSYPGFKKYLIKECKWSPSQLNEMNDVFKHDDALVTLKWIKSYCEGDIIDKSLLGVANASMSQFILKNKHGYADKQEVKQNVTFDKCYLPLKNEEN